MIVEPPPLVTWSTACLDWEQRIVNRQSLVTFDPPFPDQAEAALSIFRDLRIVDVLGRPTIGQACLPWAFDLPRILFGAYDQATGRRLIRYFFLCVSKKNTKSTLAAGMMVTALLRNWRESGEFYILAPTKEVADNSFFPARDMIRSDEELLKLLHVQDAQRLITHRTTGAFLKVVAADSETVSGKKTIGLLIDELWLMGMKAHAESMIREIEGGLTSRPEGFVIYLTTQSTQEPAGVFKQKLQHFRDIRDGIIVDPESLPIIYEFPQGMIKSKAYEDPANWYIPNPNWGKSVDPQFLIGKRAEAVRSGKASQTDWDAKFLNVQAGIGFRTDAWPGAEYWAEAADAEITVDALFDRCDVIIVGLDGGGLDDLYGANALGRDRQTRDWLSWSHAWCHESVLERRQSIASRLRDFEKAGELTITRHAGEDVAAIVELVKMILDRRLLGAVSVDPAGLGELVEALAEIGVTVEAKNLIGAPQGFGLMNAIKTAERKLENGSLRHAPSTLMDWCVGNVKIEPTATAIRATKQNAGDAKIDPWAALMNSVTVMVRNPEPCDGGPSIYTEERGFLVL